MGEFFEHENLMHEDQIFYTIDYVDEDEFEYAHCIHVYFKNKNFKVTNNIPVKHLDKYDDYNVKSHAHYVEHIIFEALIDGLKAKGFSEINE